MAIQSSDVNAGDDILATDHNYLRADLLTNDISISGFKTFADDIYLTALKKLYLDGGNNTFIFESSSDVITFKCNNNTILNVKDGGMSIEATQSFYLDGYSDTYFTESSGDNIRVYCNNSEIANFNTTELNTASGIGIAAGGNEAVQWDIISTSLDGTSPDTVSYSIDESKIVMIITIGHVTSTEVAYDSGTTTSHTRCILSADSLIITYGAAYGATDVCHTFIMYIA